LDEARAREIINERLNPPSKCRPICRELVNKENQKLSGGHIGRHFDGGVEAFVDDFTLREASSRHEDQSRKRGATSGDEALIPEAEWENLWAPVSRELRGHHRLFAAHGSASGDVAGRIRHQTKNYRAFAPLLERGRCESN